MAAPSPSVRRVVAILDFLADHPGQSFTLTDFIRTLRLSRATCHSMLSELVGAGYLFRGNDKSYVMGPALARIGAVVANHISPLQIAQPEMRRLADEFDLVCLAYGREGDEVVLRDRAASVSHLGYRVPVGTRLRLSLPSSAIFHAWAPAAEVDAWLRQRDPAPTAAERQALHDGIAFARWHGFSFHVRHSDEAAPTTVSSTELDPERAYPVAAVLAPVFDAPGRLAFALGLAGFGREMTGAEVLVMGQRLRAAGDRVTNFLGIDPAGAMAEAAVF